MAYPAASPTGGRRRRMRGSLGSSNALDEVGATTSCRASGVRSEG
jgi:hypothetical protein